MSLHRKPLLRFETSERAQLISTSMPPAGKRRRRTAGKRAPSSKRPRVVKGRVNIKVPGYKGLQKVAPSSLIPYLPTSKLRQAAKRALGASGKKKTVRKKRGKSKGRRKNYNK